MRSAAPCSGCSSPAGICSNGCRRRRRRSVPGSILPASIAGWPARSSSALLALVVAWSRGARDLAAGAAVRGALDRLAGHRALGRACRRSSPAGCRCRTRDARRLRLTARRTWRFFETFVTPADNMLPPDNFQEDPAPVLAHRTSPTNLGLYLLSVVSARDFGWIGTVEAIERLEATLATMSGLDALPRPFLQLVRHARLCGRSIRTTSPRSTAAISPGT